jgi:Domain of unknown function (DUF1877)
MSMVARFVQVAPELLTQLLGNAASAEELFEIDPGALYTEPMRQELQRGAERLQQAAAQGQLAQMLANSLAALDPSMRQMVEQRLGDLGVNVESLRSGQGGEAILRLMEQRLPPLPLQPEAADKPPRQGQGAALSLEKDWHGIHYLLCGQAEPGSTVLSQAVLGGTEFGDDFAGYGPARYFAVEKVADTARELSRTDLEAELSARFDPGQMSRLGIYPGRWQRTDAAPLLDAFRRLRQFFFDASTKGCAVITCIV